MAANPLPFSRNRQGFVKAANEAFEQHARSDGSSQQMKQVGGRIGETLRRGRQVDAEAGDDGKAPLRDRKASPFLTSVKGWRAVRA